MFVPAVGTGIYPVLCYDALPGLGRETQTDARFADMRRIFGVVAVHYLEKSLYLLPGMIL